MIDMRNSNLESEFSAICFGKVDTRADCNFQDYLAPNEGHPENIAPHLQLAKRGVIVSAGTERSFFDLLFSNLEKCEGVVVRDINARVKAYVDFNVLMLRLAKDCKDYQKLSNLKPIAPNTLPKDSLNKRLHTLAARLKKSEVPEGVKQYYLKNLKKFAKVYYLHSDWKYEISRQDDVFKACRYTHNDEQFKILQTFARAGNIISTIGSINDLSFLEKRTIAVVDTSNIADYVMLDLSPNAALARVVWTTQSYVQTHYFSYEHKPLSSEQYGELESTLKAMGSPDPTEIKNLEGSRAVNVSIFEASVGPFYSQETLQFLKDVLMSDYIELPGLGFIDLKCAFGIQALNQASPQQINKLLEDPQLKSHTQDLVTHWPALDAAVYIAFIDVEGWREAFEAEFSHPTSNFSGFLSKLRKANLFKTFTEQFGKERLVSLLKRSQTG